jgi:Transposase
MSKARAKASANAAVAYDKFHVVSQVAETMEEVRRKQARVGATAHVCPDNKLDIG